MSDKQQLTLNEKAMCLALESWLNREVFIDSDVEITVTGVRLVEDKFTITFERKEAE
jgi:hypothetical protein